MRTTLEADPAQALFQQLRLGMRQGLALASLALAPGCSQHQDGGLEPDANPASPGARTTSQATDSGDAGRFVADSSALDGAQRVATDASSMLAEGSVRAQLAPYDLSKLGCGGPAYDGGLYGQCCVKALCYAPEAGTACAKPTQLTAGSYMLPQGFVHLDGYPVGSGTCGCSLDPQNMYAASGPYAPNPAHEGGIGDCCYLVGEIECTGRPLMVEGEAVIAEIVARSDWAVYA